MKVLRNLDNRQCVVKPICPLLTSTQAGGVLKRGRGPLQLPDTLISTQAMACRHNILLSKQLRCLACLTCLVDHPYVRKN